MHDAQNPFSPYILNLFPLEKALLASFIDPVSPLARVEVNIIRESPKAETDLTPDELVIF